MRFFPLTSWLVLQLFLVSGTWFTKRADAAESAVHKTCVASLMSENGFNEEIQAQTANLLRKMGYDNPESLFVYRSGSLLSIRECLEGDYEDAILILHSAELVPGHQSLVYRAGGENNEIRVVPGRLFKIIKPGPFLRQITLITCKAEEVLAEYQSLSDLAASKDIYLRLPPPSFAAALLSFGRLSGVRAATGIPLIIAESAQSPDADNIYCLIQTSLVGAVEHGKTSCLRNHYIMKFRGYASVGVKKSTRLIKVHVDHKNRRTTRFAVLDLELGLIKGMNVTLGRDPIRSSKDSTGFSVGIAPVVTLRPVQQ